MSEQQMTNEAAKTLDGWYALHDFRTMDWTYGSFSPVMSANLSYMNSSGCLKNGAQPKKKEKDRKLFTASSAKKLILC